MEQKYCGNKGQIEEAMQNKNLLKIKKIMGGILLGTILVSGVGVPNSAYAKDMPESEADEQCETDELAQQNPLGHLHPDYEKMQAEEEELLKKTREGHDKFVESLKAYGIPVAEEQEKPVVVRPQEEKER